MKTRFLFLLRLSLFLLFYFIVFRLVFLGFQFSQTLQMGWGGFLGSFFYGLRLDFSMLGYLLLITSVIVGFSVFLPNKITQYIIFTFMGACLLAFSLIVIADAELYRHWGFRMDTSVLVYLNTPVEMAASIPLWQTVVFLLVWVVYFFCFMYLYHRWAGRFVLGFTSAKWFVAPIFLIVAGTMILPIRGSLGIAPVNSGMVYFSKNLFVNHSAVNGVWNFFYDLANSGRSQIDVGLMGSEQALAIRKELVVEADSSTQVLKAVKPNVMIIMLEGFSARVIEPLGGRPGITPCLNALWPQGIGFTNMYATGLRSDRGLVAILSGYPSHPRASAMKYPKKTQKLPSLAHRLAKEGYSSVYYYGGDTDFANMRSYIVNAGFQRMVNQDDFPKNMRNSKWGVHDGVLFDRLLAETDTVAEPFFKVLFTLSSHEPFDVPMKTRIKGNQPAEKYLNSMVYADSCLGAFIDEAKTRDWWKNTLVVLVADHSVRYPEDLSIDVPIRYTIPMLWLGGAVAKPMTVTSFGNQTDIPATVLNQLDIDSEGFYFSNDLLNPKRADFSMFIYNQGFGFVTPGGYAVYDMETNSFSSAQGDTTGVSRRSMGLFQNMIDDFSAL